MRIFLLSILLLLSSIVFAQNDFSKLNADNPEVKRKINSSRLHFLDIEPSENQWTVTFSILGIKDKDHAQQLIDHVLKNPNVNTFKIFYNRRCKAVINPYYTALELRQLLLEKGCDFDIETMFVNDPVIEREMTTMKQCHPYVYKPNPIDPDEWVYPESFPKYVDTGMPEVDKLNYARAKQEWIENHAEEYLKMTGMEYLGETNRYRKY